MSEHPVIIAFPFLPLAESITFDKWWLRPANEFDGPWASQILKVMGWEFLRSFRGTRGDPIDNPALLALRDEGVAGTSPTESERPALRKAITFATIDRNKYWSSDGHISHDHTTSDNADYWEQPIDTTRGSITLQRGGRVSELSGGHRLSDDGFQIRATSETVLPQSPIRLDGLTVTSLYEILMRPPTHSAATQIARVCTAIAWLEKTWLNSMSIGWEDRIVLLKTAFEALTGFSKTDKAAKALKSILDSTQVQEGSGVGTQGLLWQPNEGTRLRTFEKGNAHVTEIEHWYGAIADARNEIIHEGSVPSLQYQESGSPYCGPFVEIGDRVLREAIKVEIGNLGYPKVWRDIMGRCSFDALRHLESLVDE